MVFALLVAEYISKVGVEPIVAVSNAGCDVLRPIIEHIGSRHQRGVDVFKIVFQAVFYGRSFVKEIYKVLGDKN